MMSVFILLEFNDHEKTHMHYHLRRDVQDMVIISPTGFCDTLMFLFFFVGHKVVVVRCEGINISGNFYRNKRKCVMSFFFFSFFWNMLVCDVLPLLFEFKWLWENFTCTTIWDISITCPVSLKHCVSLFKRFHVPLHSEVPGFPA